MSMHRPACVHTYGHIPHNTVEENKHTLLLAKREEVEGVTDSPYMSHCPELASVSNKVVMFKETQAARNPFVPIFAVLANLEVTGIISILPYSGVKKNTHLICLSGSKVR